MIYEKAGYPFTVITGSSHGGTNGNQVITIFDGIIGEDIDVGRYNLIVQTISTSASSELTFLFINDTESTTLAIDTTVTSETIGGDAVLTTYNHVIEFKESEIGDNAIITIDKTISGYYPLNLITYASLIPI